MPLQLMRVLANFTVALVFIGVMGRATGQVTPDDPATLSLCELFADLRSHSGKLVAVRGTLNIGPEAYALGAHCDHKFITSYNWAPKLVGLPELPPTGEYIWPTALDLKYSSFRQEGESQVDFKTDTTACLAVDRAVQRGLSQIKAGQEPEIWVTVVGQLRLKAQYAVGKSSDGTLRGGGYGHLSQFPGQLVIKTMRDPVVRPKSR
jgi:hypothetical protein